MITLKKRPSLIIFFIIAAGFMYLLSTTWMKWGELVTDTSRELLTPYQILQGKVIYKDILYSYGFFPPYLISIIYRIFGISVNSLVFCGVAVTMLMSFLLYRVASFFLDEIFSGLTVITFLFVFAFGFYVGNGIFNYILPYNFASTFFMLFTTAALYFFIKFILTDNRKYLLFWNVMFIFSILSRPELSVPIWIGFFVTGIIYVLKIKDRQPGRMLFYLASPLIAGTICYLVYLVTTKSFPGFNDSIILYIKSNSTNKLTIRWAGLDDILLNAMRALGSFSLQLLIVSFLAVVSWIISFFSQGRNGVAFKIMAGTLLVFVLFFLGRDSMESFSQYRCLPLLLLTGVILSLIKVIFSKDFKKDLAIFALFLISLSTIPRIFLNTTPYNYGFYLLNLSLICYYVFFADIFKDLLAKHIKIDQDVYLSTLLIFFALQIIPNWQISLNMYSRKNMMVKTEKGTVACFNSERSARFWNAVYYLSKNTSKKDTILTFPEGASINFFIDRPYPSKYQTFLPPDLRTVGEERMIGDLAGLNIDYIVILSRDTTEYGYPSFGIDYAKKIRAWIDDNYTLVKQFGPMPYTSNEFGIAIFKRKS